MPTMTRKHFTDLAEAAGLVVARAELTRSQANILISELAVFCGRMNDLFSIEKFVSYAWERVEEEKKND